MLGYIPFILAQIFPHVLAGLITTAILAGVAEASLLCAQSTYLTVLAEDFAVVRASSSDAATAPLADPVIVRFFGVFYVFFYLASLWGNAVPSMGKRIETIVLHRTRHSSQSSFRPPVFSMKLIEPMPAELMRASNSTGHCSSDFCPDQQSIQMPLNVNTSVIALIYCLCIIGASVLLAFGIESLNHFDHFGRRGCRNRSLGQLLMLAVRQLTDTKLLLMVPMTLFRGASMAFVHVVFTKTFVACGTGDTAYIGYVMMGYGTTMSVAAAASSVVSLRYLSRVAVMAGTMCVHLWLLMWLHEHRNGDERRGVTVYFAMAALCGAVDGVWGVEVNCEHRRRGITMCFGEEA